jgi:hypothetical protein
LLNVYPTFNLWHRPDAIAGANMPRLAWLDLIGQPLPPPAIGRFGVLLAESSDAAAARAAGVDRLDPIRLRARARSCAALDDLLPALLWTTRAVSDRLGRVATHR